MCVPSTCLFATLTFLSPFLSLLVFVTLCSIHKSGVFPKFPVELVTSWTLRLHLWTAAFNIHTYTSHNCLSAAELISYTFVSVCVSICPSSLFSLLSSHIIHQFNEFYLQLLFPPCFHTCQLLLTTDFISMGNVCSSYIEL